MGFGLFASASALRRATAAIALVLLAAPFAGASPALADDSAVVGYDVRAACPTPGPGEVQCYALVDTPVAADGSVVQPASSTPSGFGPADLRSAYNLPGGAAGQGLTVAVVDAYDLPSVESDLAAYRSYYKLPACTTANGCFQKVNQSGVQGSYPTADSGWGGEIALDLDMVSAICPNCKILLVEANDAGLNNLAASVNTAVSLGAIAVSNSYGGQEFSGETSYDKYYNHPGVAITVSTGDCGYECAGTQQAPAYPAASPYVVTVGGTTLARNSSSRGWTESAWSDAGSGCSRYESKPSWQLDSGCTNRSQADVSAVADPNTGVAVYVCGAWYRFGGTSVASPLIASVFALAGSPKANTYPASYLYSSPAALNDITSGNNDVKWNDCTIAYLCNGVAGYDGPTGLGTPNGTSAFAAPTAPAKPTNLVATGGDKQVGLTWTAPATGGSAITGYTVTETEHGLGAVGCPLDDSGDTSCTVTGLTNGTEYTFTVHATNAQGSGPESDPSNAVQPVAPAVPGKPQNVKALAGIGSASVAWAAAAANRSAIQAYTVTSSPDGKSCTTGPDDVSCNVPDLTNGQPYTFVVTATNGVGTGPASDPTAAVTPVDGDTYHPVAPVRLLDTRCGNGLSGKLVAATPRAFQVTGRGSIPSGATAITANATSVNAGSAASVYLGPTAEPYPATFTINFNRNDVTAFGVTVALSAAGTLSATYMATSGTTDLVLDVTGYFTPDQSGDTYHPLTPARLLDTRSRNGLSGKLTASVPRTFQVTGRGGVPAGATAVTGNLTVVNSTNSWAVYIGPSPIAKPCGSTINFAKKQIRANSLTVALSSKGTLSATFLSNGHNTTDLVFDVTGYYTADQTGASYVPIAPIRAVDTRVGDGLSGKLAANTPRIVQIIGRGGIPANATGVTGVITAITQSNNWALFAGPDPIAKPSTSALNFVRGDNTANGITVALGDGGTLAITYMAASGNTTNVILSITGYLVPPTIPPAVYTSDLSDPRADRWQDPDYTACTAAATMSMLNAISYASTDATLTWQPTTSYTTQESILAYERANMTMLTSSPGTDPHGWRNALNYDGWGSINAGVYRDSAFDTFDDATKAAVSALARYHKPVGILSLAGAHAMYLTGYETYGDDPSTGSLNFTIVGVDFTDPFQSNAHRDTWLTLDDWENGGTWVRFLPYLETDSPYTDPVDGQIAYNEWYGKWVIIDPTR